MATKKQTKAERAGKQFEVRGHITRSSKGAVAGATVLIYDQDLRKRQKLAGTTSDAQGAYSAFYYAEKFARAEQGSADLVVVVTNAKDEVLATSPIRFNAKPVETIDFSISDAHEAKSEYDSVMAAVLPLLDGQGVELHELKQTPDHQDFTFLTQETGLPSDRIIALVNAAKLVRSAPVAAAHKPAPQPRSKASARRSPAKKGGAVALQPVFYGLLRQGLPTDLPSLLALTSAALRDALQTSLRQNIIPANLAHQLKKILAELQALKAAVILQPAVAAGSVTLGDLLGGSLPEDALSAVAKLYVASEADATSLTTVSQQDSIQAVESAGDLRQFVASLDDGTITGAQAQRVKAALVFNQITGFHAPLVQQLARMGNADPTFADPKGLATLTVVAWTKILAKPKDPQKPRGGAIGHPPGFANNAAYAKSLVQAVAAAYPTATFAVGLSSERDAKGPFGKTKADVLTFLKNNPAFAIGQTRLNAYLVQDANKKLAGVKDRVALTAQVLKVERLSRFAPSFAPTRALLADGIESAQAAAALGRSNFVTRYGNAFGSAEQAGQAYSQARTVALAALHTYISLGRASNSPRATVLDPGSQGPVNTQNLNAADQATWTTMFGSIDLCDCEDCQALDSPSAYFADILDLLRQSGGGGGGRRGGGAAPQSPVDLLFTRRPDLGNIELTCDNTNIRLPYIDLVNEILERAVADPSSTLAGVDPATLNLKQISQPLRAGLNLTSQATVDVETPGEVWAVRDPGWRYELTKEGVQGVDVDPFPQTSGTEQELTAHPQHINYKAYALIAQAGYPWSLPFNLPIEEGRAYLKQLSVARADVLAAMVEPALRLADDNIAYEQLGLSTLAANIITGAQQSDPANSAAGQNAPWTFWGLNRAVNPVLPSGPFNGDWNEALQSVAVFLEQSGLKYPDLLDLLSTYFLNPETKTRRPVAKIGRRLSIVSTDKEHPATCDVDKLQIVDSGQPKKGISPDLLSRFHRFVRLMRKLGWDALDLDRALKALSAPDLAAPVPRQLVHIQMLQQQLAQPLLAVLAFFGEIDSARYTTTGSTTLDPVELRSWYAQLFRSQSLGSPADPAFTDDPANLNGFLTDHTATIFGAMQLSADDFAALTSGPRPVTTGNALNLDNLSALYRYAVLARSLQLSVPDLLRACLMMGDPFVDPETALWFVRRILAVRASGFDVGTLAYLLRHEVIDASAQSVLVAQFAATLSDLRDQLKKIAADNLVASDPQGASTRAKLTFLKWNETYIAQAIALFADANTYSTSPVAVPDGLIFPPSLNGRVSFDATSQSLSVRGVLSTVDGNALRNLPLADANFRGAVQTLVTQSQADARAFLVNRMRAFELPTFFAPLAPQAPLPPVALPDVWKNRVQYLASTGQLTVAGGLTEGELAALLTVFQGDNPSQGAVQSLFDQAKAYLPAANSRFLVKVAIADTDADPAHTAFADLFEGVLKPADRFLYLLTRLCAYIKRVGSEGAATQTLSSAFDLNTSAVSALLTTVLAAPSDPTHTQRAMSDLTASGFVASSGDVTGQFYNPQLAILTRLQKVATIASRLRLTSDLIILIDTLHTAAGWLDWNALPVDPLTPVDIKLWEALVRTLSLRGNPLTDDDLADLLTQANAAVPSKASFVTALAAATDWLPADIEAWMGAVLPPVTQGLLNLGYPADFQGGGGLRRLRRVFNLMAKTGASPQQLAAWKPLDLADDPDPATLWSDSVTNAIDIKSAVRAKYTNDIWLSTAAPIRNRLRDLQRAALVSYLITRHTYGKDDIDLYDYFLIDVDMGSCMKTTRLSQAICSVQLFIQRCLLNVENNVQLSDTDATEWNQWRSQYRFWEANRLVLLYPENWLVPSQRDDKTPIFENLENELQQNDITSDTAEAALLHYLQQLDIVGRLEIVAICTRTIIGTDDITHVFGRTYGAPHTYFHRQFQSGLWSAWEQVDLDIDGDHLMATIWNNHLYLCWPMFNQKSDPQTAADRAANADPQQYWEIQLAWSEYLEGKWQPKSVSTDSLRYDLKPELGITQTTDDVRFLGYVEPLDNGPTLVMDCYGYTAYPMVVPPPPPPPDSVLLTTPTLNVLTIITFSVNGAAPSDSDLANITVLARKHADSSLKRTDVAQKFTGLPESVPGFDPVPLDPASQAWDAIWLTVSAALLIAPLYGVIVLDTDTLDFFLSGAAPFTITKKATNPTPPFLAWLKVDLAPLSVGPNIQIIRGYDALGRFAFSSCRSDVTALDLSQYRPGMPFQLIPPSFALFEDEMFVESPANVADTFGAKGTLGRTPGIYRAQAQSSDYIAGNISLPLAYQDDTRTYFVTEVTRPIGRLTNFQIFYHPQICSFIEMLDRLGVDGLLTLENQSGTDPDPSVFATTYLPDPLYVDLDVAGVNEERTPREIVEFASDGAYSIYNWEIFFHIPFMIATKLSANQRFQDARDWFHYIFDPTSPGTDGPARFWKFKPFFDAASSAPPTLEDLITSQTSELTPESLALAADPFQPFLIARMRYLAFMKAVVMAYLDNLIAWGDQLFAQDEMETINEATQLYVLAARILGRRPDDVPPRANPVVQTFNTLPWPLNSGAFFDPLVAIESYIFPAGPPPSNGKIDRGTGLLGTMPLFCIPKDQKLLQYWDDIDLRLFRIRNCMNAQGVVRDLAPYAPFIDPGLLVAATAAGVDLDSVLDDLYAPLPAYRFTPMLQKALELCNEVRALGSEMLSALEKRDGEKLALLRATHELNLLKAVKQIKTQQITEANANLSGLEAYQDIVSARQQYYQSREFINSFENVHIQLTTAALLPMAAQLGAEIAGAILHLVPDIKLGAPTTDGATYGGTNIGSAVQAFGGAMGTSAGIMNAMGSLSATLGGYRRRQDEWDFQADVATKELAQVAQQILAANLRVNIAQADQDNQDLQISQSQDAYDFLKQKFTNAGLYDWMASQLATIYFQSYKLAYDMAKRAERAYRQDLGLTDSSFIQFGYWDSLKKGLMAGERLQFDLRRLESDYLDKNRRELEVVKHVSLLLHDPLALVQLKETGQCDIDLPEMLFDVDFPGHYLRRLKTVSLSIPCVIGSYASINARLTLLKSTMRTTATPSDPYAQQANNESRFYTSTNPIQSVAVCQGQNDSGLFELNFRDERYLPFEGEGAISTWRLQLETNFPSFDHDTISDAILHLRYTARGGGDDLRQKALADLTRALNAFIFTTGQKGLARLFSLRDDFPVVWDQFKNPPLANGDQSATVSLDVSRFPLLFQTRTLTMSNIVAIAKPADGFEGTYTTTTLQLSLQAGKIVGGNALKLTDWNDLLRSAPVAVNAGGANAFGNWTLAAWTAGAGGAHLRLDPAGLEDVVLLVGYTAA